MNYLLHLLLSEPDNGHRIGTILGDFVKGTLTDQFSPDIMAGLRHHRRIDTFAGESPIFRRSQQRISPRYGRYRGIMVDLFYDHFTARNWQLYSDIPLNVFAGNIYSALQQQQNLPSQFQKILPRMIAGNWLCAYRDIATIEKALQHISGRLRHPNPMSSGIEELLKNYHALQYDCHSFIAAAVNADGQSRLHSPRK